MAVAAHQPRHRGHPRRRSTSAPAAGRIRPRKLGWGDYRLELTGPDGAKTITRFAVGWGAPASEAEAPDLVRVSAGTRA